MWGSPFQKCTEARKKGLLMCLVVVGGLVDCEEMNIIYIHALMRYPRYLNI